MLNRVINQCLKNYPTFPCCHTDGRNCYCYNCLQPSFYIGGVDEYDCPKKNNFYVLKYGPSYFSEIYHFLSVSQILECFQSQKINVLSLGCGFSPDYYAITQYISDKNLTLKTHYLGWDISDDWQSTRLSLPNVSYETVDLRNPFSLTNSHIIILNKLFSTIYRHNDHITFLDNLADAIQNTMGSDSFLVYNDVNNKKNGRDIFSSKIEPLFTPAHIMKYYFNDNKNPNNSPYTGYGWSPIKKSNIFPTDYADEIGPIDFLMNDVFFQYRK